MATDHIETVNYEIVEEIRSCINDGRFEYIKCGDELAGFGTWHKEGANTFINNVYIKPEFRGRVKLLKVIRDFMKKHKNIYWHNNRKNRFHYCKGEI